MIITKKFRRGERMEATSEMLGLAKAIFPQLTTEERSMVRGLIESLRQNPTPAAALPETIVQTDRT